MTAAMNTSSGSGPGRGYANGRFHIGDVVRNGTHLGTVTDVGTVLVTVTTTLGAMRMFCPWELVRLRSLPGGPTVGAPPQ
jgi:hypothetical protein